MRVIAGKARRMTLRTCEGKDIRPTTDRIKETLFNILQGDIYDSAFLDLFAGSGAIGIEALSRGAKEAVFVDNSKKALECIEDNLKHTKLYDDATILPMDVSHAIQNLSRRGRYFDIVFMDPPYDRDMECPTLESLAGSGIIDEDSIIIIETSIRTDEQAFNMNGFNVVRVKEYKTNKHVFLKYDNIL